MTTYQHSSEYLVKPALSASMTVTGVSLAGISVQEVVYILTAVLTVLAIVEKLWSMWRKWKAERDAED